MPIFFLYRLLGNAKNYFFRVSSLRESERKRGFLSRIISEKLSETFASRRASDFPPLVSDTQFSHKPMRGHLFGCFENHRLTQSPEPAGKEKVGFTGNDNRIEIRIPKLWHKLVPIDVPSKSKPSSNKAKITRK